MTTLPVRHHKIRFKIAARPFSRAVSPKTEMVFAAGGSDVIIRARI